MALAVGGNIVANPCQPLCIAVVVGGRDDHLFPEKVTLDADTHYLHEEIAVEIHVEHHRVVDGFVGDKGCQRYQHCRGQPLTEPYGPHASTRHSVTGVVEDVIHDEHEHGDDDRHSQSAFPDDCPQGCSDEEEDEAGESQGELVDGLYLVLADDAVSVACYHAFEVHVAHVALHSAQGTVHGSELAVGRQPVEQGIGVLCLAVLEQSVHAQRVGFADARFCVIYLLSVVVIHPADAVVDMVEGVDVTLDSAQTLGLGIVGERSGIGHVEVGVEVEHNLLRRESLPPIGHRCTVPQFLRLHVFKPFPTPQCQHEVLLLCRRLQHARVGQNDGRILIAVGHPVDHDSVEFARLHIFLLHIEVAVGDAVVEDTLGDFQFRTLLLHRDEQLGDLHVGLRTYVVLEIERTAHDHHRDENQRAEGLHQRNACGLDGREFRAFTQISECDERGEEDGQGQGLRHEHQTHVPKKLGQHLHRKALADELVDIPPQKLHHQHELADEKGTHKEQAKLFGYEDI